MQLLVASAVALALMRPVLVGAAGAAGTTVVLLDGSATMQATDVSPSRFGVAVARARATADRLSAGQQMAVVLLGPHAQLLASPTADPAVLRSALDRARPSGEAADLAEGVSLANAVLAGRPGGSVVLYSDGHTRRPDSPLRVSAPWRYEAVGTTGENTSVAILGREPGGWGGTPLEEALP
ncbi:MAG: vWA domain-containing protein, partial [Acidimicrobiales bacterium]